MSTPKTKAAPVAAPEPEPTPAPVVYALGAPGTVAVCDDAGNWVSQPVGAS